MNAKGFMKKLFVSLVALTAITPETTKKERAYKEREHTPLTRRQRKARSRKRMGRQTKQMAIQKRRVMKIIRRLRRKQHSINSTL